MAGQGKKTAPYMRAGEQHARWTLLEDAFYAMEKVRCRCECGTEKAAVAQAIRRGMSRSCGCFRAERAKELRTTHGLAEHPLYSTWYLMVRRCTSPKDRVWADYGGRGITVCGRWLGPEGLSNFIADVGPKPTPKHEIDRINNNGDYQPDNCAWVTRAEQLRNTRPKVHNKQLAAAVAERDRLRQLVRDLGGDPGTVLTQVPPPAQ
jgi:hypothetical protein